MKIKIKDLKYFISDMINEDSKIVKYGKEAAKYLAYTPVGLFFSMLIGCDGKGGIDGLTDRHFVWWSEGNGQIDSTCAYELYRLNCTAKEEYYGQTEKPSIYVAEWSPDLFDEFIADESIFYKSSSNQSNLNWDTVQDELEAYESGDESVFSNFVVSSIELGKIKNIGACLVFILDGSKVITQQPLLGSAQGFHTGANLDDVIELVERQYIVDDVQKVSG